MALFLRICALLLLPFALAERDFWCGEQTCYEALQVSRDATITEIKANYKIFSLQFHPDKDPSPEAREKYLHIRNAYDVLSDEESRKEYNDVLDHPELYYYNYSRFYIRYYQMDLSTVLFGLLAVFTVLDRLYRQKAHYDLIERVYDVPRLQPLIKKLKMEKLEERLASFKSLPVEEKVDKKKKKEKERKPELSDIPNSEISLEQLEVVLRGPYATLPTYSQLLPFRMIYWPWYIFQFFYFYVRWWYLFSYLKQPYGPEEQVYLTRKALDVSQTSWDSFVTDEQKEEFLSRELWKPKNLKMFLLDMRRENMEKFKQSKKKMRRAAEDYDDYVD